MNNGKVLALFDQAQQDRNKKYTLKVNKVEVMILYNIVLNKASTHVVLNMRQLLNDEEVLNFSFDDFNDSFSTIIV